MQFMRKPKEQKHDNSTATASAPKKQVATPKEDGYSNSNIFAEISHPLQLLMDKLQGFEALVEKKEMFRAAIVARDIAQTLETFDPKYFPQLFSNYFKLLSSHHEEIENYWQQVESFRWKTLEQLYHLDLKSFIDLTP
jgi:hypothetical protein